MPNTYRSLPIRRYYSALALLCSLIIVLGMMEPVGADDANLLEENPEQVAAGISGYFQAADSALAGCKLREVRQQLSLIDFEIQKHAKLIAPKDKKDYKARSAALNASVKQQADSLVSVNLAILSKNGQEAGIEFRQHLAVAVGLSEFELAAVDEAIVNTPSAGKKTGIFSPAPVLSAPDTSALVPPPPAATPDKSGALAATRAAKIRALLDEGKTDEAMTVFLLYHANMRRFLDVETYAKLKSSVEDAHNQEQTRREKAAQIVQNIENLLNQDHPAQAYADFHNACEELKGPLDQEDFRGLETRVGQAYAEYTRAQAAAVVSAQQIRALLNDKKTEDAALLFDQSRPQLGHFLPKDTFEILQLEVRTAYNTMQDKKKFCALCSRDIQSLIRRAQGATAYSRFTENKPLLKQYLDPTGFAALDSAVAGAYKDFIARQKKASADAARIDSLIDRKKIEKAHDLFDKSYNTLRQNLADDKRFFDLKGRVEKTYAFFNDKKRQAVRSSQQIGVLIDRKEGEKAYAAFAQDTGLLKEYLDPLAYKNLGDAANRSKLDYASNQASAHSTAIAIGKLLDQKHIEQAYALYRKTEDNFNHYLEGDSAIVLLDRRVETANAAFLEKKRWAAGIVRQLQWCISHKQGGQAYALLDSTKAELPAYVDAKTFSSLSAIVLDAHKEFVEASQRAEKSASHVRELLEQKRIEDASAAFDSVASSLKNYLDPKAFKNLQTQIEASSSTLQGKKKEAMQIVGTINNMLDQNRPDSAYALFQANRDLLTGYVAASSVSSLRAQVERANMDYKTNCKQAQALAATLALMLKKGAVEPAYIQFDNKRDFLVRYLSQASFTKLDSAISGPYAVFTKKRKDAFTVVSVLKQKIEQNQALAAYTEFFKQENNLRHYLPVREFAEIKAQVGQAYGNSVRGRKETQLIVAKIRGLLDKGKITEAYGLFQDSRPMLEQYLYEKDFTNLQTQVTSAYNEQEDRRKQILEFADRLRTLVAKNDLWEAYKGFKFNRTVLQQYLGPQAYADLETLVVGTYNDSRAKALSKK